MFTKVLTGLCLGPGTMGDVHFILHLFALSYFSTMCLYNERLQNRRAIGYMNSLKHTTPEEGLETFLFPWASHPPHFNFLDL